MSIGWRCSFIALIVIGTACSSPPKLPIDKAVEMGQLRVVKWHVENGADVNEVIYGRTPLHLAAMNSHDELVRFLLANGANVNARTATGETPLLWAKGKGQGKAAQILIRQEAKI